MPRVLTLDAAFPTASAGLLDDAFSLLACQLGEAATLPILAQTVLATAGPPDRVVVTVGPGSFTGLRSALALAHGIGLASGIPVLGVTVGAAMAQLAGARQLWAVVDSKRGRIFLERDGAVETVPLDSLPIPDRPVAVAGDAAIAVASRLAARGADVELLARRRPDPLGIALAASRGVTRPPQPLYVDPPAARPGPAGRPAPL